jgi:hypothetical protein
MQATEETAKKTSGILLSGVSDGIEHDSEGKATQARWGKEVLGRRRPNRVWRNDREREDRQRPTTEESATGIRRRYETVLEERLRRNTPGKRATIHHTQRWKGRTNDTKP